MRKRGGVWVVGVLMLGLGLAGATQAALVTWGPATNVVGAADVSTNGSLVGAVNLAGAQATVNGVSFAAWQLGATTIDRGTCPTLPAIGLYTSGSFSLSYSLGNCVGDNMQERNTSSASPPFNGLSAGYRELLGTAGDRGDRQITLTMGGLTLGQSYEVQVWVNDSRNQTPPGFTFPLTIDGTVSLDPNPSLADGGLGQYVLGTFVADANIQTIGLFGSEVGLVNGIQLRALPRQLPVVPVITDPGRTLLLALLGGAMAVVLTWRTRLQTA